MSRRSGVPLSQWKPAQVLRLATPLDGIEEGWFLFLGRDSAHFRVSRLGENEQGDLCETDETYDIHVDFAESFTPARSIGHI
jgi:hypothetical protein